MKIQMKHIQSQNCSLARTGFKGAAFRVLACLMMFVSFSAYAQKINVSGVVTDKNTNEPVAGAALMVKGTSTGTVTNPDGTYTIKAGENDVLVCQFFGYKTQEVNVAGRSKINVVLEEDVETLEATVVVGYGTLKKTQLVGSVENLDGEAIADRPNVNVARSLQGQVAGLNIIQTDGKASHSGQIFIRGNSTSHRGRESMGSATGKGYSIGTGGSALVLIDGVEGDISTVNPADVENVAVLKDASSAAIYGARAAYGVILVTTKTAKEEKMTVTYNGSYTLNTRVVKWEDHMVDDGLQWAEAFYEFFDGDKRTPTSAGTTPSTLNTLSVGADYLQRLRDRRAAGNNEIYGMNGENYAYYANTNYVEEFLKRYHGSTTHDISVRGAGKKLSYNLSGRFFTQDGVYKIGDDKYAAYNLRAKAKVQITDWLSIDNNTSLFYANQKQAMFSNSSTLVTQIEHHGQPVTTPYNPDGTYSLNGVKTGYAFFIEGNTGQTDNKMTVITSTGLDLNIIKNVLKIRGDFSFKAIRNIRERYRSPMTFYEGPSKYVDYNTQANSYKSRWNYDTNYISANAVLTWTPKLGDNHDLNVVGGWNLEDYNYNRFYIQRKGMLFPDKLESYELFDGTDVSFTQDGSSYGIVGLFARANYSLFKRYIVEASVRYDGSSKFPSSQQWGLFPAASLGWRLDQEPWMKWSKNWLDNFKIRANAGSTGNGAISAFMFLETMGVDKTSIAFGQSKHNYTTVPSPIPSSLTWETVTTYDVGLDADFFNSRLSFSGDIYWKNTTDLITSGPQLPDLYGASAPKGNYAALQTKGWELTLSWRDAVKLGGKDFTYSIKGSVWDTRTWVSDFVSTDGNILNFYKGKELGEMWGFRTDGYFLSNEEADNWATDGFHKNGSNFRAYAGDIKFIDVDGDGDINYGKGTLDDHGDLERIGNVTPRYQYGVNLDFRWNGIGLSLFFQGVGRRDWYPAHESTLFYSMYNRPYTPFLATYQTGDNYVHVDYSTENWVVTNADKKPYWTRRVAYSANRNVGPLAWENDYYLQNAAYVRLKNLTVDYTLPSELTRKAKIDNIRFYVTMENLWTWSPMFKNTKMFDPEGITPGDSDLDSSTNTGLGGVGDGSSYPMLRTFTFGVNLTF